MPHAISQTPGIFWTWQDEQIEDERLVRDSIADMAAHGFGRLLVQPRGCRYPVPGERFVRAAAHASACAHEYGVSFWLHLDPRSMSRYLIDASNEAAEYIIVAGTGQQPEASTAERRALDATSQLAPDGSFSIRLAYPKTRPYHVHSDGAVSFRPLRLERCIVFRRSPSGVVDMRSVENVTASSHLFVNELSGYVEVFGQARPPRDESWFALAFVAFGSNYPDFAGCGTRAAMRGVLDTFAAAGTALDGLWWDEPGYCTGFDRSFKADRGRIPWGTSLRRLHHDRTGRNAVDDLIYLVAETDDGRWGSRREAYYRTVEDAVFGAQADLLAHARTVVGEHVAMGAHQTWHQNGDDVINGCMDWWRGSRVLEAGYTDVGDAERIDDPDQMAEVTALGTIAVSLGRHSATGTANYNLWGVHYGDDRVVPGPGVVTWWADLQATLGCSWLAHTYGPTGYFERPSVWGPGYPDHPTWPQMAEATSRLARTAELAHSALPECDVALVYPLGTMYRLASEVANPLAHGAHILIDELLREGFELDIVSAETLRGCAPDRYRAVIWLHPFGAAPEDVLDLAARASSGAVVIAAGLPAVAGEGYAEAAHWSEQLDLHVPEVSIEELFEPPSRAESDGSPAAWTYRGLAMWGRPTWATGHAQDGTVRYESESHGPRSTRAHYLGYLLEGLGTSAPEALRRLGLEPAWRVPTDAIATRTLLPGGEILVKMCPARFGRAFHGELHVGGARITVQHGVGLTCLRVDADGTVREELAPEELEWDASEDAPGPR